jgi:hypothetical protein
MISGGRSQAESYECTQGTAELHHENAAREAGQNGIGRCIRRRNHVPVVVVVVVLVVDPRIRNDAIESMSELELGVRVFLSAGQDRYIDIMTKLSDRGQTVSGAKGR